MAENPTANVAVLGAGLIGIDLIGKIRRSPHLDCGLVVGRDSRTSGLRVAARMGCTTSDGGIDALAQCDQTFDIVFDATNASMHAEHWDHLRHTSATVIDLTPSNLGTAVVPTVNGDDALSNPHLNLITCGGQGAIPILHAIAGHCLPEYVEVVTTGASHSAGRATRLNLDEYIATTQAAVRQFTGAPHVKVMVNISPAKPPPTFRIAMSVLAAVEHAATVRAAVDAAAAQVREFMPGFAVTMCSVTDDRVFVAVEVKPVGGPIPRYAGNLEIINSAAILLAEKYGAPAVMA